MTQNLQDAPIDESLFISDEKAVNMVLRLLHDVLLSKLCFVQVFRLLYEEGFFVGASSGLNVAAAVELSESMPKGSTIVTCLCDNGQVCMKMSQS